MQDTLNNLIQRTIQMLSQVTGTGTQVYAEDRLAEMIINSFYTLSRIRFWSHQTQWEQKTLDGSAGLVTVNFDPVGEFRDVQSVMPGTSMRPLAMLPVEFNPYSLSGTSARYVEDYTATSAAKIFRVWPVTATGTVAVRRRVLPLRSSLVSAATVPFHDNALIYKACWEYSDDDGGNPGQTAKFQGLFQAEWKSLTMDEVSKPIELDPRTGTVPDEWSEIFR